MVQRFDLRHWRSSAPVIESIFMYAAIDISHVSKIYHPRRQPAIQALMDFTLAIPQGAFFGLLGPNGAGKSTLIKLITGLSRWDTGSVTVLNCDVEKEYRQTRTWIGVSPQEYVFDPYLTIEEELFFTGGYFGQPRKALNQRVPELMNQFGLTDKRKTYTDKLSGGMKRRLAVARALVHQPKILILDEPTAGLDLTLRHELWEILEGLNQQGMTILLTTHYLEEAEHLCDSIAIMNQGKLLHTEINRKIGLREQTKLEKMYVSLMDLREVVP